MVYKGAYVKDQWHGEGEWQDLYGTWYKGEFENGRRTGNGEVLLQWRFSKACLKTVNTMGKAC